MDINYEFFIKKIEFSIKIIIRGKSILYNFTKRFVVINYFKFIVLFYSFIKKEDFRSSHNSLIFLYKIKTAIFDKIRKILDV